jgi:hypothetical protein
MRGRMLTAKWTNCARRQLRLTTSVFLVIMVSNAFAESKDRNREPQKFEVEVGQPEVLR